MHADLYLIDILRRLAWASRAPFPLQPTSAAPASWVGFQVQVMLHLEETADGTFGCCSSEEEA
jgi:hypothetical protein